MEPLVVDTEVMRDLVQHGDAHLFRDVARVKRALQGALKNDDTVGQSHVVVAAVDQRHADIEPEERGLFLRGSQILGRRFALGHDLEVVELVARGGGKFEEGALDEPPESIALHEARYGSGAASRPEGAIALAGDRSAVLVALDRFQFLDRCGELGQCLVRPDGCEALADRF